MNKDKELKRKLKKDNKVSYIDTCISTNLFLFKVGLLLNGLVLLFSIFSTIFYKDVIFLADSNPIMSTIYGYFIFQLLLGILLLIVAIFPTINSLLKREKLKENKSIQKIMSLFYGTTFIVTLIVLIIG